MDNSRWKPVLVRDPELKEIYMKQTIDSDVKYSVVIFGVHQMREIESSITKHLEEEGKSALYNAGYQSGIEIMKITIDRWGFTSNEFWEFAPMFTDERGYGWFNLQEIEFSEDNSEFKIHVTNCYSTRLIEDSASPVCHYVSGLIAGVISELYQDEYFSIETECQAMGKAECIFEVKRH